VSICEVLQRDRRRIETGLEALCAAGNGEQRGGTLAALRELLLHHGRAANSLYGALLRKGAHPGAILIAMEAHAVAFQLLCEVEREAHGGFDLEVLRTLVGQYFEEQEAVLAQARALLSSAQERELATWHERKRAAELGAGLGH
jgi:hypothetical protein